MNKAIVLTPLALLGVPALIVFGAVIGPLFGALAGLIVAYFFPHTTAAVLTVIGAGSLKLWQIGAAFGFVSPFVRSPASKAATA